LISMVQSTVNATITIQPHEVARGDVRCTSGDTDLARRAFGWEPTVGLSDGLEQQVAWHRALKSQSSPSTS
jgi:nucleoside-diphosphate-sugar epimerase